MRNTSSALLRISLGFCLLFGAACDDDDDEIPATQLDFLQLLPSVKRVEVGETFQFGTERVYGAITESVTSEVTLSSDDESVLRVNAGNVVEAVAPGTAHVIAKYDGTEASAEVIVVDAVSAIELDVGDFSLVLGTFKPIGAVLIAGDTKRPFDEGTWGSLDPDIASVTAQETQGIVSGHKVGETTLTLSRNGLTTLQRVRVVDAKLESVKLSSSFGTKVVSGGGGELAVEGTFSSGGRELKQDLTEFFDLELEGDGDVLSLDGAAVSAADSGGTATVVATGKADTIAADQRVELEIEVIEASELQSVRVELPPEIAIGMEEIEFKILGDYGVGTELVTAPTEFTVEPAAAIGIRMNRGTIVPLKAAEVELKVLVTVEEQAEEGEEPETRDVEGSQPLRVIDTPLSMIRVSQATKDVSDSMLQPGKTLQLEASAQYGSIAQTVTAPAVWTSADPKVAVVSNVHAGLVTAVKAGKTKVKASYHGKSAEFEVVVEP